MKKLLLSLAAITAFGAAHAQKLGDVFVSGSLGYTHTSGETNIGNKSFSDPVNNSFYLMPSIGYQFDRNWAAGITLAYGYDRTTRDSTTLLGNKIETKGITNGFGIGPFVRYTRHLSPLFFVNGQFNALYINNKSTIETTGNSRTTLNSSNGVNLNVMPSIGINISRSLSVTGSFGRLGYTNQRVDNPGVANTSDYRTVNQFEATFGREFMLGVQWNIATDGARGRRNRMEPMSETRRMDRYRDNDENENKDEEAPRRRRRMRN